MFGNHIIELTGEMLVAVNHVILLGLKGIILAV